MKIVRFRQLRLDEIPLRIPLRIFTGDEVALDGYFAEYSYGVNTTVVKRISKRDFERLQRAGVPLTGWYNKKGTVEEG